MSCVVFKKALYRQVKFKKCSCHPMESENQINIVSSLGGGSVQLFLNQMFEYRTLMMKIALCGQRPYIRETMHSALNL